MMLTNFRRAIVTMALLVPTTLSAQTAFEDLGHLDVRIAEALASPVGDPGGAIAPIDRRLRLGACPAPATISTPVAGAVTVRCTALGWRIRVPVSGAGPAIGGSTVTRAAAAEPVIRRGEAVDLVITARGFSVSGAGTAEQSGAVGDRIRVRLSNGNRVTTGQIRDDGRVAIIGFN